MASPLVSNVVGTAHGKDHAAVESLTAISPLQEAQALMSDLSIMKKKLRQVMPQRLADQLSALCSPGCPNAWSCYSNIYQDFMLDRLWHSMPGVRLFVGTCLVVDFETSVCNMQATAAVQGGCWFIWQGKASGWSTDRQLLSSPTCIHPDGQQPLQHPSSTW